MDFAQIIRLEIDAGDLDAGETSFLFLRDDCLYIDDKLTCTISRLRQWASSGGCYFE